MASELTFQAGLSGIFASTGRIYPFDRRGFSGLNQRGVVLSFFLKQIVSSIHCAHYI